MAIDWSLHKTGKGVGEAIRGAVTSYVSNEKMRSFEEAMKKYGSDPFANADFDWMLQNNPEMAQIAMAKFQNLSQKRQKEYISDMLSAGQMLRSGDAQGALSALAERVGRIHERGGDPTDTIRMMKTINRDPQKALMDLEQLAQVTYGVDLGFDGSSDSAPAGVKEFDYLINRAGVDPNSKEGKQAIEDAARIRLGLKPRATGSAAITIANTPELLSSVANVEAELAGARERAELINRMALEPQLEGMLKDAIAKSASIAKNKEEKRSNQKSYGVYQVARDALIKALDQTNTGAWVGLLPAITSNQRVAEGAINIMRPVIKDAVRSAGEGTFTDRDQQLIDSMIPTRLDSPEAIIQKMEMLDNFMMFKLGQSSSKEVEKSDLPDPLGVRN